MIILFSILLCTNIYYYSRSLNTIIILHAFSFIISSQIRTPEFLKLDKYFKNHKIFEDNYITIKKEVIKFIDKKGVKNIALTRDSFSGANSYIGSDIKKDEKPKHKFNIKENVKKNKEYSLNQNYTDYT